MTLNDIHEMVSGLGHPEYPLLDRDYSPGSAMPVIDFSPILKDLILENDWNMIHALVLEIGRDPHIAEATIKTFMHFKLSEYLDASPELLAELLAILILIYRIPNTGHPDNVYWLRTRLFKNTLSCNEARINESARDLLLKRLRQDVARQRSETERKDLREPTASDFESLEEELPQTSSCQRIAAIPVTSKTVIFEALTNEWGASSIKRLRPQLSYGERQFGNNVSWNLHYVQWTELFVPPSNDVDISRLLSQEEIRTEAGRFSISLPKSYSRARMLQTIREQRPDAYDVLFQAASKDSAIVNPDFETEISSILQRRSKIEYACRGLAAI